MPANKDSAQKGLHYGNNTQSLCKKSLRFSIRYTDCASVNTHFQRDHILRYSFMHIWKAVPDWSLVWLL